MLLDGLIENYFFYFNHSLLYGADIKKLNSNKFKDVEINIANGGDKKNILDLMDKRYREILSKGFYAIVAKKNGEIIAYYPFIDYTMRKECFFLDVKLKNKEIFGVQAWVHQDYRNKGIMTLMFKFFYDWAFEKGFKRHYGIMDYKNKRIIKVVLNTLYPDEEFHIKFIVLFKKWKFFIRNDAHNRVSFTK